MADIEMNENEIGWYVSDVHCRRAIGYLSVELVEKGYLPADFNSPLLLELWGEALSQTMAMNEPSPLGPDPEAARKFLLTTIEGRISRVEDRTDQIELAIDFLAGWLQNNHTRFGHSEGQKIERLLNNEGR